MLTWNTRAPGWSHSRRPCACHAACIANSDSTPASNASPISSNRSRRYAELCPGRWSVKPPACGAIHRPYSMHRFTQLSASFGFALPIIGPTASASWAANAATIASAHPSSGKQCVSMNTTYSHPAARMPAARAPAIETSGPTGTATHRAKPPSSASSGANASSDGVTATTSRRSRIVCAPSRRKIGATSRQEPGVTTIAESSGSILCQDIASAGAQNSLESFS